MIAICSNFLTTAYTMIYMERYMYMYNATGTILHKLSCCIGIKEILRLSSMGDYLLHMTKH